MAELDLAVFISIEKGVFGRKVDPEVLFSMLHFLGCLEQTCFWEIGTRKNVTFKQKSTVATPFNTQSDIKVKVDTKIWQSGSPLIPN